METWNAGIILVLWLSCPTAAPFVSRPLAALQVPIMPLLHQRLRMSACMPLQDPRPTCHAPAGRSVGGLRRPLLPALHHSLAAWLPWAQLVHSLAQHRAWSQRALFMMEAPRQLRATHWTCQASQAPERAATVGCVCSEVLKAVEAEGVATWRYHRPQEQVVADGAREHLHQVLFLLLGVVGDHITLW